MKVATFIGTRPEIIRLSRTIAALDRATDHVLVHTGQNYDYHLNGVFFEDLDIRKPDHFLQAAGDSAAATIGNIIARSDQALAAIAPDAILVLGDTNSCLAAIAAKRRHIPVFHMEAGNRCFDERVPEEINRRIVDHISDVNLPYSDISREYLLREGIPPDRIIKTGSPMFEVLHHYLPRVNASSVLGRLQLEPGGYYVVSCHREENVDAPVRLELFVRLLNALACRDGVRIILSTHPRTRKRLHSLGAVLNPLVELHDPLGFCDYVRLEMKAKAVLSDSGTISEEASILGFRSLNLREAHERPEAMEQAAVMMTGFDQRRVLEGLAILNDPQFAPVRPPADYQVPDVSAKVVRIIHSYVNYVNRTVWRKPLV